MGTLRALVEAKRDDIHAIVLRHRGRSVAVFGSVARGDESLLMTSRHGERAIHAVQHRRHGLAECQGFGKCGPHQHRGQAVDG